MVSLFFLPLPLYLALTAVLSLFLARLHGLEVALKLREIKEKKSSRVKALFIYFIFIYLFTTKYK